MKEIDEAAYILAMGLDRGPGRNIAVSVAVGNAVGGGQGQGAAGGNPAQAIRVYSTTAPTIFTALSLINTVVERQLTPTHLKLVVFSEALARQGIRGHLDTFIRWRQFRRTIYISVTPGPARAVIESLVPPTQENPGKFLEMMILTQSYRGFHPLRTAAQVLQRVQDQRRPDRPPGGAPGRTNPPWPRPRPAPRTSRPIWAWRSGIRGI